MSDQINLENLAIVLHRPRYPENIGAAARAMRNMGLRHLLVVAPENYDRTKVLKLATHAAADVVQRIKFFESLKAALAEFNYVVGTTARLGGQRRIVMLPSKMAAKLVTLSQANRIAIVFGPEDRGLSNANLRLCHGLVNIPAAEFSSLNLAQAVMVMCYEMFTVGGESADSYTPRLAARHELDGMYEQLKDILVRISFINPENPDYWLNNLRHFFTRLELRAREVRIIRGICRQIDWYGKKCFQEGLQNRKRQ